MGKYKRKAKKTRRDVAEIASENLGRITGEAFNGDPLEQPEGEDDETRNPAPIALSKLGASKGGKARAARPSKKKRPEIAKRAAQARWAGHRED
jgi:hypothetical protein